MKSNSPVSSVMSKAVVSVNPTQKLVDVKRIFESNKFHHHIPVVEGERLVGMISLHDFFLAIKGAGLDDSEAVYNNTTAGDIMSINIISKDISSTVREVALELSKNAIHAIPILDNHKLAGIVTTTDLIKLMLKEE